MKVNNRTLYMADMISSLVATLRRTSATIQMTAMDWKTTYRSPSNLPGSLKEDRGTWQYYKESQKLPSTVRCPSSHQEFVRILEGVDRTDIKTVTERIKKLQYPGLDEENRTKR